MLPLLFMEMTKSIIKMDHVVTFSFVSLIESLLFPRKKLNFGNHIAVRQVAFGLRRWGVNSKLSFTSGKKNKTHGETINPISQSEKLK